MAAFTQTRLSRRSALLLTAGLLLCATITHAGTSPDEKGAGTEAAVRTEDRQASKASFQTGTASWYGGSFVGRKTASGERYLPKERTAAHRTLPFGTFVRVTNLRNRKTAVVRINNRGPYIKGRIIDLSRQAAIDLGMVSSGVARVQVEVVANEAPESAELAAL